MLTIGEEWSDMGARYERGELEYASGYEKMYGVTDEQLAFLSWHQGNLCRFAVQPIYDSRPILSGWRCWGRHLPRVRLAKVPFFAWDLEL